MLLADPTLQQRGAESRTWSLRDTVSPTRPTILHAEGSQRKDDTLTRIDEVANQDVEMADPPAGGYCYLVLDTNVLIDQLSVLKWFCDDIEKLGIALLVIVPNVVLSELDGLKKRDDIQWFAQTASSFLLERVKERKSVKVQARAETCHTQIDDLARKNDLAIFDCCCYFKQKGQLVLLSSDKNLSLECEKEGILTIQPPKRLWTSRDLARTLFSGIDFSRFHGYECVYRRPRTSKNLGVTEAPPSFDEDQMDIDDAHSNVTTSAESLVPSHALDDLHLQLIDHFTLLIKELTERVRKENKDDLPAPMSKHAPGYRRRAFKDWDSRICLEYLGTKKTLRTTSPELWKFLLKRSEDLGWRRGQDWSRQDWIYALGALEEVGEKFREGAISSSLEALKPHVTEIFLTPMRPTGI